jgi:predicted Zn-dependent protease
MLHELGHVAGFDEYPNLSACCVMKPTILAGQSWRTLCDVEARKLRERYGLL